MIFLCLQSISRTLHHRKCPLSLALSKPSRNRPYTALYRVCTPLVPHPSPPMVKVAVNNMNLGGPGWFNDVFDVKVFFNTDKRSIPTNADEDDSVEVRSACGCACFCHISLVPVHGRSHALQPSPRPCSPLLSSFSFPSVPRGRSLSGSSRFCFCDF